MEAANWTQMTEELGSLGQDEIIQPWIGVLTASLLLMVCVIANGVLIGSLHRKGLPVTHGHHRAIPPCNVEKLVCLIAAVSLLNGCCSCIFQIVSFLVQGKLLQFFFLIISRPILHAN